MKKWLKTTLVLGASLAPVTAFISCGDGNAEKQIVVAKEGVQEDFWKAVNDEFEKTEAFKQGYRIKFVEKDVFGAIDHTLTTGFTDSVAPDLLYAPHDRITGLLQNKAIMKMDPKVVDKILKNSGASEQEIAAAKDFGKFSYRGLPDTQGIYNLIHNKEGIVVMTAQDLDTAKAELAKAESDSMLELVKDGKAFFRIQDGWYGNGVLGGVLSSEELGKIFYKKNGKWASGFVKTDENHAKFKQAVDLASELMFPIFEGAYQTKEQYENNKFKKAGITQDQLKSFLSSDMNNVQRVAQELVASGKLKYALVGSWDILNSTRVGINTFFNAPNLKDGTPYKQASGSWSWSINARNQAKSEERKNAINTVLETIYSTAAFSGYFNKDSKIPFFKKTQEELNKELKTKVDSESLKLKQLATELGYKDPKELLARYEKEAGESQTKFNKATSQTTISSTSWTVDKSTTPLANENKVDATAISKDKSAYPEISDELFAKISALKLEKITGLRNVVAGILGLTDLTTLTSTGTAEGKAWLVNSSLIKDGVEWKADLLEDASDKTTAHVRKIEKEIFGVNGDNAEEKAKFFKDVETNKDKVITDAIAKAKEFTKTYAKAAVADSVVEEAVKLYVNNFANEVQWLKLKDEYTKKYEESFASKKFPKKDNSDSTKTYKQISEIIKSSNSSEVAQKIVQVITSTKSLNEGGFNTLKTQESRLDHANPQFGNFWGIWNDQTFGNASWYAEIAKDSKNIEINKFKELIEERLSTLFGNQTKVLDSSNAVDYIKS